MHEEKGDRQNGQNPRTDSGGDGKERLIRFTGIAREAPMQCFRRAARLWAHNRVEFARESIFINFELIYSTRILGAVGGRVRNNPFIIIITKVENE